MSQGLGRYQGLYHLESFVGSSSINIFSFGFLITTVLEQMVVMVFEWMVLLKNLPSDVIKCFWQSRGEADDVMCQVEMVRRDTLLSGEVLFRL